MKIKELWKKFYANKNLFILVCVAILTISSIGVSYSAFFTVKSNSNNQTVSTGTLDVSYTGEYLNSETDNMSNQKLMPVSDAEGLAQTNAKVVHIENGKTNTLDSEYALTIGYDMEAFKTILSTESNAKLTPIEFIKFAVYEVNTLENGSPKLVAGPMTVADLPIYKYDDTDYRNNRYLILKDKIKAKTSTDGGTTKSYQIKVWLSDTTTPAASQTYFYVNSEVEAIVEGAKQHYTVNGTLLNGTEGTTPVVNATINIQNGSYKATTEATAGTFTLENLPQGTYNVAITLADNSKTYNGIITIRKGEYYNVTNAGTNFTAEANKKVFDYANQYYTTVKSIMDTNNIKETSDTNLVNQQEYNSGPSYIIDCNSSSVSNLKITLNDTDNTFTVSV